MYDELWSKNPLVDFIWLRCPYFEIFAFERELFIKSAKSRSRLSLSDRQSLFNPLKPLEQVSEKEWNDDRVSSELRSEINNSLIQDRIDHQNLRNTEKYTKVHRKALFDNLVELHRLTGPPEVCLRFIPVSVSPKFRHSRTSFPISNLLSALVVNRSVSSSIYRRVSPFLFSFPTPSVSQYKCLLFVLYCTCLSDRRKGGAYLTVFFSPTGFRSTEVAFEARVGKG